MAIKQNRYFYNAIFLQNRNFYSETKMFGVDELI